MPLPSWSWAVPGHGSHAFCHGSHRAVTGQEQRCRGRQRKHSMSASFWSSEDYPHRLKHKKWQIQTEENLRKLKFKVPNVGKHPGCSWLSAAIRRIGKDRERRRIVTWKMLKICAAHVIKRYANHSGMQWLLCFNFLREVFSLSRYSLVQMSAPRLKLRCAILHCSPSRPLPCHVIQMPLNSTQ